MTDLCIAIVTMNRPEIIEDTLEHLDNKELIDNVLIVDGSDNSETKDVCSEHPVDYYRQESEGMTSARNEALEKCESDYIAFIDDDVRVSDSWYEAISETFKGENTVGVTGKLLGAETDLSGFPKKIRDFLFGGRESFGEIKDNGVINGDFFYDDKKEVDHMPGCNMAYRVSALNSVGGFQEKYDVGNSYREDTIASYLTSKKGKIIYNPQASLRHLAVDEEGDEKKWMFYNPYLTKYFLYKNSVVKNSINRLSYIINMQIRHVYFLLKSIIELNPYYLYYLYGEIQSFIDFILLDRKPREYI